MKHPFLAFDLVGNFWHTNEGSVSKCFASLKDETCTQWYIEEWITTDYDHDLCENIALSRLLNKIKSNGTRMSVLIETCNRNIVLQMEGLKSINTGVSAHLCAKNKELIASLKKAKSKDVDGHILNLEHITASITP